MYISMIVTSTTLQHIHSSSPSKSHQSLTARFSSMQVFCAYINYLHPGLILYSSACISRLSTPYISYLLVLFRYYLWYNWPSSIICSKTKPVYKTVLSTKHKCEISSNQWLDHTNLLKSLLCLGLNHITGSNNCNTAMESLAHAVDNTYKLCCPIKSNKDFKKPCICKKIISNIKKILHYFALYCQHKIPKDFYTNFRNFVTGQIRRSKNYYYLHKYIYSMLQKAI